MAETDDPLAGNMVARALDEDLGAGDLTTDATVPVDARARARITQKQAGVIFGLEPAVLTFRTLDPMLLVEHAAAEGQWREAGAVVLEIQGLARALLAAERTALNFLAHLSGIATFAARADAQLDGTETQLLDTRKTTPGLRALEKAAVAAGGGQNHRHGLSTRS